MVDSAEEQLKILMSEKDQADKQIASYLELQVKVHTFIFTAAAAAAGWIFAQNKSVASPESVLVAAVLALAFLSAFATLQGVIIYGIVLGYIRYKHLVVGEGLRQLLKLNANPLLALQAIASSSSNRVVMNSSIFGSVFFLGCSGGLLGYSLVLWWGCKDASGLLLGAIIACAVLWLGTVIYGLQLARSVSALQKESENEWSRRNDSLRRASGEEEEGRKDEIS